jgi:hypothetical protein
MSRPKNSFVNISLPMIARSFHVPLNSRRSRTCSAHGDFPFCVSPLKMARAISGSWNISTLMRNDTSKMMSRFAIP